MGESLCQTPLPLPGCARDRAVAPCCQLGVWLAAVVPWLVTQSERSFGFTAHVCLPLPCLQVGGAGGHDRFPVLPIGLPGFRQHGDCCGT